MGGILASSLGEVGTAAATPAHSLGDLLDELACRKSGGEVLRDGSDQVNLPVEDAPHADHPRAEPGAQGVGDRAEPVGIQPVDTPGDHRDPVDLTGRRDQVLGARACQPRLEIPELLLEHPLLVEQLLQPSRDLEGSDLEDVGRLAERRLTPGDARERGRPRNGLDAPAPWVVSVGRPYAPVRRGGVPPHSSVEKSPILITRTRSPYFSPKSAIAPVLRASSRFISLGMTGVSACTCSFTRSSMRPISRSFTWPPCEKSNRR